MVLHILVSLLHTVTREGEASLAPPPCSCKGLLCRSALSPTRCLERHERMTKHGVVKKGSCTSARPM